MNRRKVSCPAQLSIAARPFQVWTGAEKEEKKNKQTNLTLTTPHSDTADVLLPQKVPDLHHSSILLNDDVDGEMGIHRSHFVAETLQSDKRRERQ